jgi:membrane protease YdiL (CAAX protease family)
MVVMREVRPCGGSPKSVSLSYPKKGKSALDLGAELLLNLEVYLALALAAAVGVVVLGRFAGRWFPLPRLRRGGWSGGEVLLCFLLFNIVPTTLVYVLDQSGFFFWIFGEHVKPARQYLLLEPLRLVLLFALYITLVLYPISGTRPSHVGLTAARWQANIRLGLAAFCLVTPLVLGLYFVVHLLTPSTPHPLEELIQQPHFGFEWGLIAFGAVIAAPLLEEWLFRGLLQGWLRRASLWGHLVIALLALTAGILQSLPQAKPPDDRIVWEALVFSWIVVTVYTAGVLRIWWPVFQSGLRHFVEPPGESSAPTPMPVEGQTPVLLPQGPRWEAFKVDNARWAIVGSAMIFALLHVHWPDPVALFPLGLVLGWLAYRTQSLIPGIVLHTMFNAVAFGALWFSA